MKKVLIIVGCLLAASFFFVNQLDKEAIAHSKDELSVFMPTSITGATLSGEQYSPGVHCLDVCSSLSRKYTVQPTDKLTPCTILFEVVNESKSKLNARITDTQFPKDVSGCEATYHEKSKAYVNFRYSMNVSKKNNGKSLLATLSVNANDKNAIEIVAEGD